MEEKTINEQYIKFSSKVPTKGPLKLGDDVTVNLDFGTHHDTYLFNCVKSEDLDNQDGTINRIFTLKSLVE